MIKSFKKSFFISEPFLKSVLHRNKIDYDKFKHIITYNLIDYSRFSNPPQRKLSNFLYTGSLGHWNNIETYLDFFKAISIGFPNSKLIICTATPYNKLSTIISAKKYDSIRDKIELHFNVPYDILPEYYGKCEYGLQLMNKKDSRVGVKFIEYIAAGVVPIVHENVLGAAKLANDYNLGVVVNNYDLSNPSELIERIKYAKKIDPNSDNYRKVREITDIGMISNYLCQIFDLNEEL